MPDKETTIINKITKNGKFEINTEIEKAINFEQTRIDGSVFGIRNQKLWLKQNFPKMAKMTISGPKRWNSTKN